jgi:hypothetical protein
MNADIAEENKEAAGEPLFRIVKRLFRMKPNTILDFESVFLPHFFMNLFFINLITMIPLVSSFSSSRRFQKQGVQLLSILQQTEEKMTPQIDWPQLSSSYIENLTNLLYPPGQTLKIRRQQVRNHPLYNFLHTYYRYSAEDLMHYSPGIDTFIFLPSSTSTNYNQQIKQLFHPRWLVFDHNQQAYCYSIDAFHKQWNSNHDQYNSSNYNKLWQLHQNYQILQSTSTKLPFFGCFGMHEWAMLYSGRQSAPSSSSSSSSATPRKRHQAQLPLRISQEKIDELVESQPLRCSHFDAWRFFHPSTQPWNIYPTLSRQVQVEYEQPGCIHATMDLFKFAYQLYPLVSSSLLLQCLTVAIEARNIDIRASPYDVSSFQECQEKGPLCVETSEGRKQYLHEQETLYQQSKEIRQALLIVYDRVFTSPSSSIVPSLMASSNNDK